MICKKCGEKNPDEQKFCTNCGKDFSVALYEKDTGAGFSATVPEKKENKSKIIKIIRVVVIAAIISWTIYANIDEDAIDKNNKAISNFDSGNSEQAIDQFKAAVDSAVTNDTKTKTLINLGYAYISEGQTDLAIQSFKQALDLSKPDTFDYHLIMGEVAYLELDHEAAELHYLKAYDLDPNNFQINNALNLFYIDLSGISTETVNVDYPKALEHAKKAYAASTKDVKNLATQNLGLAYFFNEDYDETIRLLLPYADTEPYVAFFIGLAYINKNDDVNAKTYILKAQNNGVELPQEVIDYLNS